jgi:hypothetical protein
MSVGKANKRSKVLRRIGYLQKSGLSGSIVSLPPKMELAALRDGEPCTHPCEGCGRVGGVSNGTRENS